MGICDKVDWNFNDFLSFFPAGIFNKWAKRNFSGFRNYFNGNLLEICSLPSSASTETFRNPTLNWGFCGWQQRFLWKSAQCPKIKIEKVLLRLSHLECAFAIMSIIMKCRGCLLNATWGHQCGKKAIKRIFLAWSLQSGWEKFIQIPIHCDSYS